MDAYWTNWLSEWMDEDPTFINECQMNSLDDSIDPFTIKSFSSYPSFTSDKRIIPLESSDQKPPKMLKTAKWNSSFEPKKTKMASNNSSSSSITISFARDSASPTYNNSSDHFYGNINVSSSISQSGYEILEGTKSVSITARTSVQAQDHVLAERKRRERLTERFIALSALIPQLTKMDKASVLADAIKYIKELKERVETLEGEVKEKNYVEIVACSSNWKSDTNRANKSFPEIEVRVLDKSLLVTIYSEKQSGFLVKALSEVEKVNLQIISSNVMPFANNTQLLTITAQMDDEFDMTANDLVNNLHLAIQEFM